MPVFTTHCLRVIYKRLPSLARYCIPTHWLGQVNECHQSSTEEARNVGCLLSPCLLWYSATSELVCWYVQAFLWNVSLAFPLRFKVKLLPCVLVHSLLVASYKRIKSCCYSKLRRSFMDILYKTQTKPVESVRKFKYLGMSIWNLNGIFYEIN